MLDKSVPFHTIIMKRSYEKAPVPIELPVGYKIRAYEPGDEIGWAEIQTEVLEFDSMEQALNCHQGYISRIDDLKKRQWFIESPYKTLIATATAWYDDTPQGKIPVVHALSCRPEYQGNGFGRAVAIKMLESFYELDTKFDVWLDTQTWSYKAVELYLSLGFVPMKQTVFNGTQNEYEEALPVFKEHMRKEAYQKFLETAI
jgi:GNAT superfamily N-acetyltransferase